MEHLKYNFKSHENCFHPILRYILCQPTYMDIISELICSIHTYIVLV